PAVDPYGKPPPLWPSSRRQSRTLEPEQDPLHAQSSAVPADLAARRDDTVTRDHDRYRIASQRLADRTAAAGPSDAPRDLPLRHDLTGRHARGRGEHAAEKRRDVAEVEPQVEGAPLAGEVGAELMHDLGRPRRRANRLGSEGATQLGDERRLRAAESDAYQPGLARRDQDAADGRRQGAPVDGGSRPRRAVEPVEIAEHPAKAGEPPATRVRAQPARHRSRRAHPVD